MEDLTGHTRQESDGDLARIAASASADAASAFEELIQRHFNTVHAILYARLPRREEAEDAAQEAFLRAFIHLRSLSDAERFVPWLCQIARNLAMQWHRRNGMVQRLMPQVIAEDDAVDAEDIRIKPAHVSLDEKQQHERLARALQGLSPERRTVVLLHYSENLNPRQIGERLGMHRSTVQYHLDRALLEMRDVFDPWLKQAVPRLARPRSLALRRTAAGIAVIVTMSEVSRQALAASVVAGGAGSGLHAGVTAGGGASAFLGKLMGLAHMGVFVMKAHKVVAASLALLALLGGGAYYQKQKHHAAGLAAVKSSGGRLITIAPVTDASMGQPQFITVNSKGVVGSSAGMPKNFKPMIVGTPIRSSAGAALSLRQSDAHSSSAFAMRSPLKEILSHFARTPSEVISGDPAILSKMCVISTGDSSKAHSDDAVREVLAEIESQLDVKITSQTREVVVGVLKAPNGPGSGLRQAANSDGSRIESKWGSGILTGRSMSMPVIAHALGQAAGGVMVDETGLTGLYDYDLNWNPGSPQELLNVVKAQLGLEISNETRPMVCIDVAKRG